MHHKLSSQTMSTLRERVALHVANQEFELAACSMRELERRGDQSSAWWAYTLQIGAGLGDTTLVAAALTSLAGNGVVLKRALLPAWRFAQHQDHPGIARHLEQEVLARWPDDVTLHAWHLIYSLSREEPDSEALRACLKRPLDLAGLDDDLRAGVIKALHKSGHGGRAQFGLAEWVAAVQARPQAECVAQLQPLIELALALKRDDLAMALTQDRTEMPLRYLRAMACAQRLQWQELSACGMSAEDLRTLMDADAAWYPYAPYRLAQLGNYTDKDLREVVQRLASHTTVGLLRKPRAVRLKARPARLRVAYLSADFRSHPVGDLLAPVWQAHNKSRFEWFALDNTPPHESPQRQRILSCFDQVIAIRRLSDQATACAIKAAGIDIVVSLGGFMVDGRENVLAHSAAPLHMAWLGVPGSLGPPYVDYTITDVITLPDAARPVFAEAVVRLPVADRPGGDLPPLPAAAPARRDHGLPESALVLACFNQHNKISADTFAQWCAVLKAQPSSVLWLTEPGNALRHTLLQAAASHGIAAERLYWAERLPLAKHVERIACADLVLDCHPFTMHATAVNALAAGVPFLTYCGGNSLGRVSASLLHTAGLGDCVCDNALDYVQRMVVLAQDDKARTQLRQRFAAARDTSALFDNAAFARYLEEAYDKAYARWLVGLPPADIKIERRPAISV